MHFARAQPYPKQCQLCEESYFSLRSFAMGGTGLCPVSCAHWLWRHLGFHCAGWHALACIGRAVSFGVAALGAHDHGAVLVAVFGGCFFSGHWANHWHDADCAHVFYPTSALPESLQSLLYWNPLTFVIEQSRNVLIWGTLPDFAGLFVYSAVSLGVAWLGLLAFKAMRSGFADVL